MITISPRYSLVCLLQLLLLGVDITCNSISVLFGGDPVVLLVLCMIQDIGLLFSLVLLFLVFFNTFVFRAGLMGLLVRKFAGTLLVGAVYILLTLVYQVWNLSVRWNHSGDYQWSDGLQAVYVLQKLTAVVYYYLYKRAALRLGDTKYYEDSSWLRKHMSVR